MEWMNGIASILEPDLCVHDTCRGSPIAKDALLRCWKAHKEGRTSVSTQLPGGKELKLISLSRFLRKSWLGRYDCG
jgi:hypothetical protein